MCDGAELERLREKLAHAEAENMGLREELTTELERLREENERLQKQWDESFAGKTGRMSIAMEDDNARLRRIEEAARKVANSTYPDMRELYAALENDD